MLHLNRRLSLPESAILVQSPMKASIEEIPEELWQAAWAREAVIRPLAASPHVGRAEIEGAASALGIRRAYVYRLLAAYRRRPQTSTLVPQHRGRPQNARVLDPKVEKVIEAGITGFYLTRERPRFSDLMPAIRRGLQRVRRSRKPSFAFLLHAGLLF
jgi:putative transposase